MIKYFKIFALLVFLLMIIGEYDIVYVQSELKKTPIKIQADKLTAHNKDNRIDFEGNVRVDKQDMILTANLLTIFFHLNKDKKTIQRETINQMIATGNVRIEMGNKTAITEKAIYTALNGNIELIGKSTKVWQGKNIIKGHKITISNNGQSIEVEGGRQKQVEAIIFDELETLSP